MGWAMAQEQNGTNGTVVELEKAVHFTAPGGEDVIVEPGQYRLEEQGKAEFRLISGTNKEVVAIKAVETTHTQSITAPVALAVPGEEDDILHIVLLLAEGKSVEAVGSYSGIQSRQALTLQRPVSSPQLALAFQHAQNPQLSQFTKKAPAAVPVVARSYHIEFDMPVQPGTPPQKPYPPVNSVPKIHPDGSIGTPGVRRDPLSGEPAKMWQAGATLTVRMTGGTARVRSAVQRFASEWTQHANIKFAFVDDTQPAVIKIDFDRDGFSWSVVGTDALGIPFNFSTMHFGWFDDNTPDEEFRRTVLHEFGHALGLIHEHQSPVAGIQWNRALVYADMASATPPWERAKVDSHIFTRYSVSSTNFSHYDPTSIMQYPYPASWTLDGRGVPFNTVLSATDIEFIRRWYPYPTDAIGVLRTQDDCDEINFTVAHRVVPLDKVRFELRPGANITWWKSIKVPVGGAGYAELQMQDGRSAMQDIDRSSMDSSRPIRFSKAKMFGAHTMLGYTWPVMSALPGGSRVTLEWVRDKCG
jgi:hypothetical protein